MAWHSFINFTFTIQCDGLNNVEDHITTISMFGTHFPVMNCVPFYTNISSIRVLLIVFRCVYMLLYTHFALIASADQGVKVVGADKIILSRTYSHHSNCGPYRYCLFHEYHIDNLYAC
jgi:hypothetical protein